MSTPLKRPRVDSDPQEDTKTGLVKDKEAWFHDGNIDIVAGGIAFRVHRSVLSIHSELFRDMLSIPQPTDKGSSCDIPSVEVTDSADDMRHLLLALYFNNECFRPHKTVKFKVVDSLIRLAHKYQVKSVLDDAMTRLKAYYPDDMDQFIKVLNDPPVSPLLQHDSMDSLQVIRIARLTGDTALLRPAFYLLCQAIDYPGPQTDRASDGPTDSDEDIARAIVGIKGMQRATDDVREEASEPCGSMECYMSQCRGALKSIHRTYRDVCADSEDRDAFRCMDLDDWAEILCRCCMETVKERENAAQYRVWEDLPTIFNFRV
ncbi:uncharacterized protein C8Q71DRAFT_120368 [Rhodofomes roseus]|uniref:BTB domain-containing protein n=1 Tax=Rhodofomes roseus TaxID=34475 RepID=A0ABQ8KDL2_9APHY|nr:uncharacterized protein C8Q71DRAFT_120368 [Rhodofomes roseus]KAH9835447.1 hypothetical protein C8Q71DRAFT_120368 [Rhodofomes roseus]